MTQNGPNLSLNQQGKDVALLQSQLSSIGYAIDTSEIIGELFVRLVEPLQSPWIGPTRLWGRRIIVDTASPWMAALGAASVSGHRTNKVTTKETKSL